MEKKSSCIYIMKNLSMYYIGISQDSSRNRTVRILVHGQQYTAVRGTNFTLAFSLNPIFTAHLSSIMWYMQAVKHVNHKDIRYWITILGLENITMISEYLIMVKKAEVPQEIIVCKQCLHLIIKCKNANKINSRQLAYNISWQILLEKFSFKNNSCII